MSTCQGEPDGPRAAEEVKDCVSWAYVGHLLDEFVQNFRLPGVGLEERPAFLFPPSPHAITVQNSIRERRGGRNQTSVVFSGGPELSCDLGLILNRSEFSSS